MQPLGRSNNLGGGFGYGAFGRGFGRPGGFGGYGYGGWGIGLATIAALAVLPLFFW